MKRKNEKRIFKQRCSRGNSLFEEEEEEDLEKLEKVVTCVETVSFDSFIYSMVLLRFGERRKSERERF